MNNSFQETPIETLYRYQRNFLVHSFLYYRLNENIISDEEYDRRCKKLIDIMYRFPELTSNSPYYTLCEPVKEIGSGYYITEYPPQIISRAFHLLYNIKKPDIDFSKFVEGWGYKLSGNS